MRSADLSGFSEPRRSYGQSLTKTLVDASTVFDVKQLLNQTVVLGLMDAYNLRVN